MIYSTELPNHKIKKFTNYTNYLILYTIQVSHHITYFDAYLFPRVTSLGKFWNLKIILALKDAISGFPAT